MAGKEKYYSEDEFNLLVKEKPDNSRIKVTIGMKVNSLEVIGYYGCKVLESSTQHRWFCRCTCGNIVTRISGGLLGGRSVSCEDCTYKYRRKPVNKLTTKDFIERSMQLFPDRLTYTGTVYVDCKTKVTYQCKIHGEVTMDSSTHFNSMFGCPHCADEHRVRKSTITQEDFISDVKMVHGDKYDLTKTFYTRAKDNVTVTCRIHGDFEVRAAHFKAGTGCAKCGKVSAAEKISGFYNDTVIERFKDKHKAEQNNIYVIHLSDSIYKIGIAKDVRTRRATIKYHTGVECKEIYIRELSTYDAYYLEKRLHESLADKRYVYDFTWKGHTELFSLTEEEVAQVISEIKQEHYE